MNDKYIRTVPPLSLAIIAAFDAISAAITVAACVNLSRQISFLSIAFLVIMAVDIIAAIGATRNLLQNGVIFHEDRMEFTNLDDNNEFLYAEIKTAEVFRDSRASLKKTYTQRYSNIILHLKDGTVATVELGATTKKKLTQIEQEIKQRISVSATR